MLNGILIKILAEAEASRAEVLRAEVTEVGSGSLDVESMVTRATIQISTAQTSILKLL